MQKDQESKRPNEKSLKGSHKSPPESGESAASLLSRFSGQILNEWTSRVRRSVSHASDLAPIFLLDSIPAFLDELIHKLKTHVPGIVSKKERKIAAVHGEQRSQISKYTLEEVIYEYQILRKVIFEYLEQDHPIEPVDRDIIIDAIDNGIQVAAQTYSHDELKREKAEKERAQVYAASLNGLLECSPIGIAFLDRDLRYLQINSVLAKMNNVSPEAHIGKSLQQVLPAEDAKHITPFVKNIIETGTPQLNIETSIRPPGDPGKLHYYLGNYFPVQLPNSEIIGLGATMFDITATKEAEILLRENEAFQSSILESSEDCITILDIEGRLLNLVGHSYKYLELEDPKSLNGVDWLGLWVRPEDQRAARQALQSARRGERGHFVGYYLVRSGKRLWWDVVISPMRGPDGQVKKLLVVSRDVTAFEIVQDAKRKSERQLQFLADSVPVLLSQLDSDRRYVFVNKAFADFFGHPLSYFIGKTPTEALGEKVYTKGKEQIDRVLAGEKVSYETTVETKDGESVHFLANYTPEKDDSGQVIGWIGGITDITPFKKAELALRSSESQFRELANSIPQMAWMADQNGEILWFNQRWYDYTGTKPEDMAGFSWLDQIHHPDFAEKSHQNYLQHIRSGQIWEDTFPLRSKSGQWRWFLSRAHPIHDENGKIVRWFGTNTDINDLREVQRALQESKERYDLALRVGKIGVYEMDFSTPQIKWSDRQYEIFGVDHSGPSLTYDVFLSTIYPEDRPLVAIEYENCIKERRDFQLEYRIVHKDLGIRWIKANGRLRFDTAGAPIGMMGVNIDITDEKRAEAALKDSMERFRTLAESLPQLVWKSDLEGFANFFNHRWHEYSGLSFSESEGQGWHQAIHPEDRPLWEKAKAEVQHSGRFAIEQRIRRHDGVYRWHLVKGAGIEKESLGVPSVIIGSCTDIEELKLIQNRLQEEKEMRERFTNALAHDLRNPIAAARMSLELAIDMRDEHDSRERVLSRAIGSLSRTDKMIENLLDANRINAGEKLSFEISECNLPVIIHSTIEDLTVVHSDRFIYRGPEELKGYWSCDGLRRVIENLCNNAIKYGFEETPVTISLVATDDSIQLKVHNYGEPISKEDQAKLFEIFTRATTSTKNIRGWGIGLSLVKGIAEAHGGQVFVESAPVIGTTFTVEIPRHANEKHQHSGGSNETNSDH